MSQCVRLNRDDHRAFLTLIRLGSEVIATTAWGGERGGGQPDSSAGQLN